MGEEDQVFLLRKHLGVGEMRASPLLRLREILNTLFVARGQAIDAVLAGLVSGEPTILIGPPGTAKTKLVEVMASAINARYFYYLLTKFTEPDELLGPLDIRALREGRYVRITKGRLPEAEIVFLDEVFKASSAIRNVLLDIMLNKRYFNGGDYRKLPMVAMYSASNEVSYDVEDAAFYDRFVIRAFLDYVPSHEVADLIMKGVKLEFVRGFKNPLMTVDDVRKLQQVVMQKLTREFSKEMIGRYVDALDILESLGVKVSDRRKVKVLKVAAAISLLYGGRVMLDDIADALLLVAPSNPDDVTKVKEAVVRAKLSEVAEVVKALETLRTEVERACERAMAKLSEGSGEVFTEVRKIKQLMETAKGIKERYRESLTNPRVTEVYRELKKTLQRAYDVLEKVRKEITAEVDVGEEERSEGDKEVSPFLQ